MPRVRLPVCYKGSFIRKGRKTVQEAYLHGEVSADVPELSGNEVRVVAEWTNILFPDDGPLNRTRPAPSRVVSWNGDLYVPAGLYMEDTVPADIIAKTLETLHDEVWHYQGIYNFQIASPMFTEIGDCIRGGDALEVLGLTNPFAGKPKPKFTPADTLVSAESEGNRAIVQKIVESLIFVDGTVWKKVPSIQLQLNMHDGFGEALVTVVHGAYGYNHGYGGNVKWEIDRYLRHRHYALNEIGRLLADVGPGIDLSWEVSKLVIHDHEAIRFNGASNFTARAMESAVLAHENSLGTMSSGLIDDWLAVRSAVDLHKAFPREELLQEDVDRLFRLLDADTGQRSVRWNETIKKHVIDRSSDWDQNILMPSLGHHDSTQWQSQRLDHRRQ